MLKNTLSSYGLITKLFHWFIGIAIVGLLVIGFIMVSICHQPISGSYIVCIKQTGVLVLFLVSLRVLWRLINVKLELPADLPLWQKLASKFTHFLLYIFMFLMPVSGILMSRFGGHEINIFNLFLIPPLEKSPVLASFFNNLHGVSAFVFAALIVLHISAGLYHHFVRKDNLLIRMIK